MKKRFLFGEIRKHFGHKNAVVITGMRQVGKTTLMRQIYDETEDSKLWFDFDNPLDLVYFEEIDYHTIYDRLVSMVGNKAGLLHIFIDEIQNFPEITKIIKFLIDHYKVKFFITGSSNFYLKNLFPESLSGRKFLYVLQPMGFMEYLYFRDLLPSSTISGFENANFKNLTIIDHEKRSFEFDQFMNYGGFPEVVTTNDNATKSLILKNIFSSFFEKDIRILSDIKDIRELRDLILMLVPRTGNLLDISKLSSELSVNRVKLYHYLELLQALFFIWLVPKYSRSIDRSVAGGKKVYFTDTGILNYIGRINEGQLFENTVANQLNHYSSLSFYNVRNTEEIDFITDNKTAFEVKINATEKDVHRLKKQCLKLNIPEYYVVTKMFKNSPGTISPCFL